MAAIVLLLFCAMLVSCARHVKETRHAIDDHAARHILIASGGSRFKDNIRERLVDAYRTEANIDVISIASLESVRPEAHDVILIMESCLAGGRLNRSVRDFLDNLENRDRVILFMTFGSPPEVYRDLGVEAITSASVVENAEAVLDEIHTSIRRILHEHSRR